MANSRDFGPAGLRIQFMWGNTLHVYAAKDLKALFNSIGKGLVEAIGMDSETLTNEAAANCLDLDALESLNFVADMQQPHWAGHPCADPVYLATIRNSVIARQRGAEALRRLSKLCVERGWHAYKCVEGANGEFIPDGTGICIDCGELVG